MKDRESKQVKRPFASKHPLVSTALKKQKIKPPDAQKELRRLEREIEKLEIEIYDIDLQRDEYASDYEKLLELDDLERLVKGHLDSLLEDWESLAEQVPDKP